MRTIAVRHVLVAGLVLGLAATAAGAASHVRVVLDVSGSMKTNDPERRVVLATLLLHDLASPNTTLGDTFKILPFDSREKTTEGSWEWKKPSEPMPVSTREWIEAKTNHRDELVRRLRNQTYDSIRTFFYPVISRSIDDLRNSSQAKDDVRVIVLVTDGVPEPATRDREAELIRQGLVPALEQHGIRLYILAFSNEAYGNLDFFDNMILGSGTVPLGARFVDATGRDLLDNMLEIFGRSFGYTKDTARQLPGVHQLDLEKGVTPERVAVVVLSPRQDPPDKLTLKAPPNGLVNNPGGVQRASEKCGSYALRWVLVPDKGAYGFDTDVTQGSVAMLRPTRLELQVLAVPPHSADRTMARTKLPLKVLVRSASGAGTDPGLVTLSFQPFGPRNPDPGDDPYLWQGEEGGALSTTGQLTPEGRVYEIEVEFPENQNDPRERYGGFLEVEGRRGEALVGSLRSELAHRIEVHPRLEIVTSPAAELAAPTALEAGQGGCAEFALELKVQEYELPKPEYGLRAVLDLADPAWESQELREAAFTLDGRALHYEGKPGQNPGEWYKGRTLARDELLGTHEICVTLGEPTRGDPANPLELPLVFSLQESPYDEFGVVDPFMLRMLIAPPTFLQKWSAWILAGIALLLLLAALWYLRDRPALPEDLRYAMTREGSAAGLQPIPLPEGSVVSRLLGLVVERPIKVPGESRTLGQVRPVREELFRLRPARNVAVEAADRGARVERHGKLTELEVHRTYRLRSGNGAYLFRMEYL